MAVAARPQPQGARTVPEKKRKVIPYLWNVEPKTIATGFLR